jgi:hypothetical protein
MYVKIENGTVTYVGVLVCGVLSDGRCVSNYNLLPPETLLAEGWLPLELNEPEYDPATQELQLTGYTINADKVIANYTAVDIVHVPTVEERLECAEAVLMDMIEIMMV